MHQENMDKTSNLRPERLVHHCYIPIFLNATLSIFVSIVDGTEFGRALPAVPFAKRGGRG